MYKLLMIASLAMVAVGGPLAYASVYNSTSVSAQSSSGSSASASVYSTTVANGNDSTTNVSVTTSGGGSVSVDSTADIPVPPPPPPPPSGAGGAPKTQSNTTVNVTTQSSSSAEPTTVKVTSQGGGASVSIVGDEISVTLRPAPDAPSQEASTVKLTKSSIVDAVVIVDLDGDGKPDAIDTPASENAAASKPKEIVVVGSNVRASAELAAIIEQTTLGENPRVAESISDLAFLVARAMFDDANTEDVTFGEGDVEVVYTDTIRLFGIFPVAVSKKVSVAADGRVGVSYPWWSFLAKKNYAPSDTATSIETALVAEGDSLTTLESPTARQAVLFSIVATTMRARHEVAMNSVRNLK